MGYADFTQEAADMAYTAERDALIKLAREDFLAAAKRGVMMDLATWAPKIEGGRRFARVGQVFFETLDSSGPADIDYALEDILCAGARGEDVRGACEALINRMADVYAERAV